MMLIDPQVDLIGHQWSLLVPPAESRRRRGR